MPFTIATLKVLHTLLSTKDRCNSMQMRFVFGQPQAVRKRIADGRRHFMRKIVCILNPAAANGRAKKIWPKFSRALEANGLDYTLLQTERRGHATELARQALHEGAEEIILVGGDGTTNEVVNGFFENEALINPNARLGIVPRGTGTDLARTLPLPAKPEAAARQIAEGKVRRIDLGRLQCTSMQGESISRYYINVADLGLGGAVIDRVNGFTSFLGSTLAYFVGLLYTLVFYQNHPVHYRIDDRAAGEGRYSAIFAANGQFLGGGMWAAPKAQIDDGLLDFILVGDVNKLDVLLNLVRLYRGTLEQHPKVTVLKGRKLAAWSADEVLLDMDGEMPGKLPATFEILPGALQVYA